MISSKKQKWYEGMLEKASLIGQLSDLPQYKIGAILVYRKSIISTGFNKKKTHPLQQKLNQYRIEYKQKGSFIHAEVDCLCNINIENMQETILFIGRKDKNNKPAMCRPCDACLHLISLYGIREIVYNTPNGYAIEHLD